MLSPDLQVILTTPFSVANTCVLSVIAHEGGPPMALDVDEIVAENLNADGPDKSSKRE